MEHPDTGQLQAFLDGETSGVESQRIQSHLERCGACQKEVRTLETAAEATDLLGLLDVDPRLEEAKRRLQARRGASSEPSSRPSTGYGPEPSSRQTFWERVGWRGMSLPRAASIALLFTGVTVSALPGSPVRRWLAEGLDTLFSSPEQTSVEPEAEPEPAPEENPSGELPPESGAGISVLGSGVQIRIHGMAREAELVVRWTEGDEAWVFAGSGTRFNTLPHRLEATVPAGDVRIEIPRDAPDVTVEVNGEVLLRKIDGEVQVQGNVQNRSASEIRFGPSGVPNARPPQGVPDS